MPGVIGRGAVHVQGTINGYGERTGNCNLTSVIPCVALKMKKTCVPRQSLEAQGAFWLRDEVANLRHNPRLPWVGAAAFAHKAARMSTPCRNSRPVTNT